METDRAIPFHRNDDKFAGSLVDGADTRGAGNSGADVHGNSDADNVLNTDVEMKDANAFHNVINDSLPEDARLSMKLFLSASSNALSMDAADSAPVGGDHLGGDDAMDERRLHEAALLRRNYEGLDLMMSRTSALLQQYCARSAGVDETSTLSAAAAAAARQQQHEGWYIFYITNMNTYVDCRCTHTFM